MLFRSALNRKGLEEALEREISTFRRKETPLSVALLDIDNFKALINYYIFSFGYKLRSFRSCKFFY